ncbi:hypothetical protein V6N11_037524 [Hibiscus sabdariffa]
MVEHSFRSSEQFLLSTSPCLASVQSVFYCCYFQLRLSMESRFSLYHMVIVEMAQQSYLQRRNHGISFSPLSYGKCGNALAFGLARDGASRDFFLQGMVVGPLFSVLSYLCQECS